MAEKTLSKTEYTAKNAMWSIVGKLIGDILGFISRSFFIKYLGLYYLGLNSLFTSVLSVLSLAELGIGSAITFSLYKPLSEGDTEKIKSLMKYYKRAYTGIALAVTALGLIIMPFLRYIVSDWESYASSASGYNPYTVYLIILATTATSYLLSYKRTLIIADQKEYVVKNFTTLFSIFSYAAQIVLLITTKNFYIYLCVALISSNLSNIFLNVIINGKYPYIKEKNVEKLDDGERKKIGKNVRALIVDKLGTTFVYQTDNIITSAIINTVIVGVVSNYNTVITTIAGFVNIITGAAQASLGHFIANADAERRYELFKTYRFIHFWQSSFATICIFALIQPFMKIWVVEDAYMLDMLSLFAFAVANYINLERGPILYFKIAGGIFDADKWLAFVMGIVNVGVSIGLGLWLGVAGIYFGTIVTGMLATIVRPIIVYKRLFKRSSKEYFVMWCIYAGFTVSAGVGAYYLIKCFSQLVGYVPNGSASGIFVFLAMCVVMAVLVNLLLFLVFGKTKEFKSAWRTVKNVFNSYKKRFGKNNQTDKVLTETNKTEDGNSESNGKNENIADSESERLIVEDKTS